LSVCAWHKRLTTEKPDKYGPTCEDLAHIRRRY
jgi:hypothetical protein